MIEQDTIKLLRECDAGVKMGVSAIDEVMDYVERKELKKVAKLGEKTYNQCAGFIRISDGKNPLDRTSVHPESAHYWQ